jgi:predicted secreted protein with PEFG-CTERM motif
MMKKFVFSIIFILILFPLSQSFSQEYTDTNPSLTISANSDNNFIYRDSEGYTVVIGFIENNDPLSFVTDVVVQANFYNDFNSNPLEVKEGTTTLKVIPPNTKSPFMIRSDNPNIDITDVSTKLLTFDTSEFMKNSLRISINDVSLEPVTSSTTAYTLSFSGILRNGDSSISDTAVHLAFYDVFNRIIQISSIEIGDIDMNGLASVKLTEEINSSSVGFLLYSESDKFYSDLKNMELPTPQFRTNLDTACDSSEVNIGGNCTSYDISNGHVTSATVNTDDNSVIINIQAEDDGTLTISPSTSTQKGIFMVLVDGEESDDAEINGNTVIVPFGAETEQIEIIGTFVIPEFGTIAAMILAVAIISIIAISAKSRLSIVPRY